MKGTRRFLIINNYLLIKLRILDQNLANKFPVIIRITVLIVLNVY